MTKILFVMTNLRNGGITSSLLNLLNIISSDKNLVIDVLLFDTDLKNKLPENVNILPENKYLRLLAVSQKQVNKENIFLGILRILLGLITKLFGNYVVYELLMTISREIGEYDYAFSCTQSAPMHRLYGGCNEFVLKRVKAQKKIAFLHCDYINYGLNTRYSSKIYSRFDKIAAVSEGVKEVFLKEEKALSDRVFVVHNCHNFEKMVFLSKKDTVEYDKNRLNLLTVARLAPEKGHMRLLDVLHELRKKGYDFCWHIVGGADRHTEQLFMTAVLQKGLQNNVKMYHDTDNPYRFFPNADALILPSYHEAAPMVFSEAEFLCLPVIATDTTSAAEFVTDKNIGIVCSNDSMGLYDTLKLVLDFPEMLKNLKNDMRGRAKPTNEKAIKEFFKLIDK